MKQKLILLLTLFITGILSVNAQVTIGSDNNPHDGSILDLQSTSKGVLFPKVYLEDTAIFQLADNDTNADGMVVYNTNSTIGIGFYFWDGTTWNSLGGSGKNIIPEPDCISASNITIDKKYVNIKQGERAEFTVSATGTIRLLYAPYENVTYIGQNIIAFSPTLPGIHTYNIYVNGCTTDEAHMLTVQVAVTESEPLPYTYAVPNGKYVKNYSGSYLNTFSQNAEAEYILTQFSATNETLYVYKFDAGYEINYATALSLCSGTNQRLPNLGELANLRDKWMGLGFLTYEYNGGVVGSERDYWSSTPYDSSKQWGMSFFKDKYTGGSALYADKSRTYFAVMSAAARCVWSN